MAPILPPPSVPPQVASVQAPAVQAPVQQTAPSRFKDLSSSQARWLEILEKHGILRTNPSSQLFGPEQAVHRDEMLMSESRLVELILRRDQEQQVLIDRLKNELAELRSQQAPLAAMSLPALKAAEMPITIAATPSVPFTLAAEPIPLPPTLSVRSDQPVAAPQPAQEPPKPILKQEVEESTPLAVRAGQPVRAATLLTTVEVQAPEPMTVRADKTEARAVEVVRTRTAAGIDLSSIVRHRNRLRQFPYLQRFLDKAAYLDPASNGYSEYVQTYLASTGMTTAMLAEAARQAAWFDTQPV